MLNILGLIPARGGSKGIPRKNIKMLGGRPLIAWTIDAARQGGVDRVVVSTDDEEIAQVARREGAEVPFMRPSEASGDAASALSVIRHAVETLCSSGWAPDVVAYLQPTSPFRHGLHVKDALRRFSRGNASTLVSVQRVPHNMVPSAQLRIEAGGELAAMEPLTILRRQDKPQFWARNGPAILVMAKSVCYTERLYTGEVTPFEMDRLSSFDLDDQDDWDWAERLLPLAVNRSQ